MRGQGWCSAGCLGSGYHHSRQIEGGRKNSQTIQGKGSALFIDIVVRCLLLPVYTQSGRGPVREQESQTKRQDMY
jgi:hypothetical protein